MYLKNIYIFFCGDGELKPVDQDFTHCGKCVFKLVHQKNHLYQKHLLLQKLFEGRPYQDEVVKD